MPVPQISVEGRIVGDVTFKFSDDGMAISRFRMIAADRRQQADGTWVDADVFWVTVTSFRKLAENVADSLRDRDAVVVTGKLSTPEWVDETGNKRSGLKLIASSIGPSLFFLPRPHSDANPAPARQQMARQQPSRAPQGAEPGPNDDPWVTVAEPTSYAPGEDPWA
jgi:single-strand DNA-binding protein